MKPKRHHPLDLSTASARAPQGELAGLVETRDRLPAIRRVAGLDVGFDKAPGIARAAAVVLSFPELDVLEQQVVEAPIAFPYVPGLLS